MKKTNPIYYALLLLALTLVSQMFNNYNYSYFVDEMSLITLQQASVAKIIFLVFDGLNDLVVGFLSDKIKFKSSKRKTWLTLTMPFYCAALILTFAVNGRTKANNISFFIYYTLITIIFDTFSSIMYVNYGALFTNLYKDNNERTKSSSLNHLFEIIGMGIIFIGAPVLKDSFGYLKTTLIISISFVAIMVFALLNINENQSENENNKVRFSIRSTFKDVIHNKPFVCHIICSACLLTILGTLITILPFLCKYTIRINGAQQSVITATAGILIVVSIKIWSHFIKKWGSKKVYRFSFNILPYIAFILGCTFNFISCLVAIIVCAPFVGGILLSPDLIMGSIIDEDKKSHHVSREASLMACTSFVKRGALLIAAVLLMLSSSFFGYTNGTNPGENPALPFRIITMLFLPLIAVGGAIAANLYVKYSTLAETKNKERL